jgi:hypothetical protein
MTLAAELNLWVPKTGVTWADAVQIVFGPARVRAPGGQASVRAGVR